MNLPNTLRNLQKIKGVGRKTIDKYGKDLLEMVLAYRENVVVCKEKGGR